jgi:hypothetical protein
VEKKLSTTALSQQLPLRDMLQAGQLDQALEASDTSRQQKVLQMALKFVQASGG